LLKSDYINKRREHILFSAMPDNQAEIMLGVMGLFVLLISCDLAFALLSSFLIHDKKKAYIWMGWMALGGLYCLVRLFPLYRTSAIAALLLYVIFQLAYLSDGKEE